jgi:hypothetical protein
MGALPSWERWKAFCATYEVVLLDFVLAILL